MARMPTPTEITDLGVDGIAITWSDGHASRYAWRHLRLHCPCALCVHEWTGERLLHADRVPAGIRAVRLERVGAYALRFVWSDGHDTGLYPFPLLRQLCQCPQCTEAPASGA